MIGKYSNRIVKHFYRNEHLIRPFISNGITSINSIFRITNVDMKRMNDFIESADSPLCPVSTNTQLYGNETKISFI